ncbi:Uncharacterised protein [Scardovia inopinata]|uniref:Uncharacterized protein n=1 Tax=Scardovia inopinata F0304 TaxID=641146 RepID=W1MXA5_SCAIO|nr:hypothetical protein HMPREF9020_01516 [Scardovia inopinata F0304]SUV50812.1 Uncharacterised protein [Scardovia inopinata]
MRRDFQPLGLWMISAFQMCAAVLPWAGDEEAGAGRVFSHGLDRHRIGVLLGELAVVAVLVHPHVGDVPVVAVCGVPVVTDRLHVVASQAQFGGLDDPLAVDAPRVFREVRRVPIVELLLHPHVPHRIHLVVGDLLERSTWGHGLQRTDLLTGHAFPLLAGFGKLVALSHLVGVHMAHEVRERVHVVRVVRPVETLAALGLAVGCDVREPGLEIVRYLAGLQYLARCFIDFEVFVGVVAFDAVASLAPFGDDLTLAVAAMKAGAKVGRVLGRVDVTTAREHDAERAWLPAVRHASIPRPVWIAACVAADGLAAGVPDLPVHEVVQVTQQLVGVRLLLRRIPQDAGLPADQLSDGLIVIGVLDLGGERIVEVFGVHAFVPVGGGRARRVGVLADDGRHEVEQNVTLSCRRQTGDFPPQFSEVKPREPDRLLLARSQLVQILGRHRHWRSLGSCPTCHVRGHATAAIAASESHCRPIRAGAGRLRWSHTTG